jgi:hypothetical protein
MWIPAMAVLLHSLPKHVTQNTTKLRPHTHTRTHTQEQTQYRRPTVKEHDHQWDSRQDLN